MKVFSSVKLYCGKYWFRVMVGLAIGFLLTVSLYNGIAGEQGSYNTSSVAFESVLSALQPTVRPRTQLPNLYENSISSESSHNTSSGESAMYLALGSLFPGFPFIRCRPDFLKNETTGMNLELDAYNKMLALGVEYNGRQHYEYTPFWHKSQAEFKNQKYRDQMKALLCRQNDVLLITVPYTVKNDKMVDYIYHEIHTLAPYTNHPAKQRIHKPN